MTSAVVPYRAVTVGQKWSSRNGRRDGLSIDSSYRPLCLNFSYCSLPGRLWDFFSLCIS
jgi:hypothetical protein